MTTIYVLIMIASGNYPMAMPRPYVFLSETDCRLAGQGEVAPVGSIYTSYKCVEAEVDVKIGEK